MSFGLLLGFALVNLRDRIPGSNLILVGIVLNVAVIAVIDGMPVTGEAVVRAAGSESLDAFADEPGVTHHLVGPGDRLAFLGDVIPVAATREVVSVGDILAYAGAAWLMVSGMLGRRGARPRARPRGAPSLAEGIAGV